VLDNLQVHTGFTSRLAHRGHLTDRGARVLGCDQGVGLRGDVCQLGDYFLLLGQIESHCTPPIEFRLRLLPFAVLGDACPWHRRRLAASRWWPLQKIFPEGTIYAGRPE